MSVNRSDDLEFGEKLNIDRMIEEYHVLAEKFNETLLRMSPSTTTIPWTKNKQWSGEEFGENVK